MRGMLPILASLAAAVFLQPAYGQTSLNEQQYECDRLRQELASARRILNAREHSYESYQKQIDATAAGAAARGHSAAKIDRYRIIMGAVRDSNGSVSDAQRSYDSAREAYEMQGCSTGGTSTYNYNVP